MRWQTIKLVMWSAAAGAIGWWIVLSAVFGWMTPGRAQKQMTESVQAAVLDVRVPICVARFQQDSDRAQKVESLKNANSWARDDLVAEQGWATMPGAEKPETGVAAACASRILAAHQP